MRAPVLAAALSAIALSVISAGCGIGSDGSSTPRVLSAAEWRREANAICRDSGRNVRRVPLPKKESEISAFVAQVVPLWRQQEDRLGALAPPEEIAVPVGEYLSALRYLEKALVEIHIATQRNDGERRSEAADKRRRAARDMRHRALIIGVPACAGQRIP